MMRRENVLGDKNNTSKELKIAGQGVILAFAEKGKDFVRGSEESKVACILP